MAHSQPWECGQGPAVGTCCAARDKPKAPPAAYSTELRLSGEDLAVVQPEGLFTVSPGHPQAMPLLCHEATDVHN